MSHGKISVWKGNIAELCGHVKARTGVTRGKHAHRDALRCHMGQSSARALLTEPMPPVSKPECWERRQSLQLRRGIAVFDPRL